VNFPGCCNLGSIQDRVSSNRLFGTTSEAAYGWLCCGATYKTLAAKEV
jgi:hypothetical protein